MNEPQHAPPGIYDPDDTWNHPTYGSYARTLYTIARIYDVAKAYVATLPPPSRWQRIKWRVRRLLRFWTVR